MAFTRTTTINSAPGGDSVKQAVLDLDTDLTGAFGHLNTLDSTKLATATAGTTYAPIAKGVTNGDTHDHSGGDGAQIAYSGLSGLPALGSMAAQNTSTYAGPGSSQAFTVGAFTQTGNALLAQTTGNVLIGTTVDDGVNKLQVNGNVKVGYGSSSSAALVIGDSQYGFYVEAGNLYVKTPNSFISNNQLLLLNGIVAQSTTGSGAIRFHASGDAFGGGAIGTLFSADAPAGQDMYHWSCVSDYNGSPVTVARLHSNGNITNTNNSYGPIASDIRLKENITYGMNYLDKLCQLRVAKFSFKSDHLEEANQLGFIAQEVADVFPNLIDVAGKASDYGLGDEEDVITYKASVMLPMAIRAIQELSAKVTTLEEQLNAA